MFLKLFALHRWSIVLLAEQVNQWHEAVRELDRDDTLVPEVVRANGDENPNAMV